MPSIRRFRSNPCHGQIRLGFNEQNVLQSEGGGELRSVFQNDPFTLHSHIKFACNPSIIVLYSAFGIGCDDDDNLTLYIHSSQSLPESAHEF